MVDDPRRRAALTATFLAADCAAGYTTRMSLTSELKRAIRASGQSVNEISRGARIAHPIVLRFMNGQRDITLRTADKLVRYLKIEIASPRPKGKKKPAAQTARRRTKAKRK